MKKANPETTTEYDNASILERPNGFFWVSRQDGREYGPFGTLLEALQDMQSGEGAAPEPGESLQEAEAEIGVAEWIDPETGEPAEEERPRLEEH